MELQKLARWSFRENARRVLGVGKEALKGLQVHHPLPVERVEEIGNAIAKLTGLPVRVAKTLIHHPRFAKVLDKAAHGKLTTDLRRALSEVFRPGGVPPAFTRVWETIVRVHKEHGIDI